MIFYDKVIPGRNAPGVSVSFYLFGTTLADTHKHIYEKAHRQTCDSASRTCVGRST